MSQKVKQSTVGKVEKVISLSDIHFGSEDKEALNLAVSFIRDEKPDTIVLNGDILDADNLSDFLRNPVKKDSLLSEIEATKSFLSILRVICPYANIVFIEGNHEDRLRKLLWKHPIILSLTPNVTFQSILDLDLFRIKWLPYGDQFVYRKCVFTHGVKTSKACGVDNIISYGGSGTSGHTHRLTLSGKTVLGNTFYWVESGCLCNLKPDYVKGIADWQHGFAFGWTSGISQDLLLKPMRITNGDIFG